MMQNMDVKHVRAFAQRNWARVEQAKRTYLAAQAREDEATWSFWASQSLFEHMRSLEPRFPANVEHDADLAHHVELKRLLSLAANARPSR
jgi:hypothetical protein